VSLIRVKAIKCIRRNHSSFALKTNGLVMRSIYLKKQFKSIR
jgi:hypothetical protein